MVKITTAKATPAKIERNNKPILLVAPNTPTIGPPCGTASVILKTTPTALATAEPAMILEKTYFGLAVANGMAPSVIPIKPIKIAGIPADFSSSV